MDKLKPCLFCKDDYHVFTYKGEEGNYCVRCYSCGARGPIKYNEEHAINVWNYIERKNLKEG